MSQERRREPNHAGPEDNDKDFEFYPNDSVMLLKSCTEKSDMIMLALINNSSSKKNGLERQRAYMRKSVRFLH